MSDERDIREIFEELKSLLKRDSYYRDELVKLIEDDINIVNSQNYVEISDFDSLERDFDKLKDEFDSLKSSLKEFLEKGEKQ